MENKAAYAYPVEIKGNVFLCHLEKHEIDVRTLSMDDNGRLITVNGEYNLLSEKEGKFFEELMIEGIAHTSIGDVRVREVTYNRDWIGNRSGQVCFVVVGDVKDKELKALLEAECGKNRSVETIPILGHICQACIDRMKQAAEE